MNRSLMFGGIALTYTLLFFSAGAAQARTAEISPDIPVYNIERIISDLPEGERWITHLEEDLLPFWTMETALGGPEGSADYGRFPTYRNNDGSLLDPEVLRSEKACEELSDKLSPEFQALCKDKDLADALFHPDREYVRSHSRQVFAYGIAYHMTGKPEYLKHAKAGVEFLRNNAIDREKSKNSGGAYSYYITSKQQWGPDSLQRTSQDMAYALTGLGFYYYLTHDSAVLEDILFIKDHIFKTYFDPEKNIFNYVLEKSPDGDTPDQKELVAQLDQLYAYMLWLTPSLPEPYQKEWKKELHTIADIIIEQFFSERYQFFWGQVTDSGTKQLDKPHTDFGHSIKTMWLLYQIGKMTDDITYVNFAKEKAAHLISLAYDKESKSWGQKFDQHGKFVNDKEWWALAELDQTTATLSLVDPSYAEVLSDTYYYWFTYMVDHKNKGIWHLVNGDTNEPVLKFPKQHSWKTTLHTFEHALIGYMTTQQLKGKEITLYYAFENFQEDKDKKFIHPYFYQAKIKSITNENAHYKVVFTDLR